MVEKRHLPLASPSHDASIPAPGPTSAPSADEVDAVDDPLLAFEMSLCDAGADEEQADASASGATRASGVGVRLGGGAMTLFDGGDAVYARGEKLVCEAPTGVGWGVVSVASHRALVKGKLPRVLRRASAGDAAAEEQTSAREAAVLRAARAAVREAGIAVKLVRAEAVSGGQKFVVTLATEDKVPFRDLLAAIGHATGERVEVRQIGQRDAAKIVGGVGPCGLQLCCNTFLADFTPVTLRMAKDQGFARNPDKAAGLCGKLFCCLVYEEAYYRAQRELVPRIGERVSTPRGPGRVRDVDVLDMVVTVALESGSDARLPVAEVTREPERS